jgi:hypothetical protein
VIYRGALIADRKCVDTAHVTPGFFAAIAWACWRIDALGGLFRRHALLAAVAC